MNRIFKSIDQCIGHTPLLELTHFEKREHLFARLLAKPEYLNPSGSVKDRTAKQIILDAEEKGILTSDSVIIEPSSGNTGIAISAIAASRGYRAVIVMSDSMSKERRSLIKAYGAQLILTPGEKGMKGAVEKAEELRNIIPHSFIAGQFVNPSNPLSHYLTTGPEIWEDTDGKTDIFIAGAGTGGTLTGTGKFLKEKNPSVQVIAAEPFDSPVLSAGKAGPHKIQGIGAGFIPAVLDSSVIDEVIPVKYEDALSKARTAAKTEGVLCGISSGAVLHAAVKVASRKENTGKMIVVLLPDSMERYLSCVL